jgi:hypothetical protein
MSFYPHWADWFPLRESDIGGKLYKGLAIPAKY